MEKDGWMKYHDIEKIAVASSVSTRMYEVYNLRPIREHSSKT